MSASKRAAQAEEVPCVTAVRLQQILDEITKRIKERCKRKKEDRRMPNVYTAVTKQDGDWWIGWIEEVPGVNCQERTRDELLESLRITLKEALEINRQEAINAAAPDFSEESVIV